MQCNTVKNLIQRLYIQNKSSTSDNVAKYTRNSVCSHVFKCNYHNILLKFPNVLWLHNVERAHGVVHRNLFFGPFKISSEFVLSTPQSNIAYYIASVDPRGHDRGFKGRDCTPSIISHPLISSDVLDNATTPLNT